MRVHRRRFALLFLAILTVTAGCSGGILGGDGPIEATASPVSVSGSALEEAGFEEADTREVTINRTVSVQDQERRIIITNHVAGYRPADSGSGAEVPVAVAAVSTPQVQALGVALNPVANMGVGDAVQFAAQTGAQFGGSISNIEQVDSWETTVLGDETTVTKFTATVERDGRTVDLYVHATKVQDGDDIVLVIAAYPQVLEEQGVLSGEDLAPMFEGVEHETD